MTGLNLAASDDGHDTVFCEVSRDMLAVARNKTRKLILVPKTGKTIFFDLEKDPTELEDRSNDPAYQDEIAALKKSILAWRPQDAKPDTYLDENAPVINQPNVPPRDNSHRESIIAWYDSKMKEIQNR